MTNDEIVKKAISDAGQIIDQEMMRTLSFLGEQCVKRIRERPMSESWIDRTGNLRSSIGYVVAKKGQINAESSFTQTSQSAPIEGAEQNGGVKGRAYARTIASETKEPYALVLVAGMEYAPYVEAKQNKDVLASTEIWAKGKLSEYLDRTKERINKKLERL